MIVCLVGCVCAWPPTMEFMLSFVPLFLRVYGLAVAAAFLLYNLNKECGVAPPGFESLLKSPPARKTAATNSAQ